MNQSEIIESFVELKKIAVIGASSKPDKWGYKIFKKLSEKGYEVVPVHKSLKEIEGNKVYNSVLDIESNIDGAVFVVNPEIGIKIAEDIIKKNIKFVWLQPGAISDELLNIFEKNNVKVVHTACIYVYLNLYR
ncbi:MAG: CoA-binding protein [Candidatus Muirbacterium halophilum]|nr:CoA-binding protein [Candidatus Muirbacterium halophilum]MCK9474366.1 CoA-binding protein [Candidatus Muirbacterium halophilum]